MKDFIKEFGDDQAGKNIPVKFEPADEWGFEPNVKHTPLQDPNDSDDDDQQSFPMEELFGLFGNGNNRAKLLKQKMETQRLLANLFNKKRSNPSVWSTRDERELQMVDTQFNSILKQLDENKISNFELKEFTKNVVIKYLNESMIGEEYELLKEQKEEIVEKIKLYESRSGFMSMTFHDDINQDECILGARIDPTNNKDWILTKEEVICKLPYSYKNSLLRLFNEVRKKN